MSTIGRRFRWSFVLFPPAGLVLLWMSPARILRKVLGTLALLMATMLYAALAIFLLIRFTGLQVEWRGGYIPALTYRKTIPDYEALDRHRAKTTASSGASVPARNTPPPYWTAFRGPLADGHYDEQPIQTNWPSGGPPLLWRQPAGGGYGSFVIADGLAVTIEQRRENETVVAYQIETGAEAWTHGWPAHFDESMGGDGPRSTPTYDAGKIYALGAMGQLSCLDAATGSEVWSKNVLTENNARIPTYGVAASPVVFGTNKLLILTGGGSGRSIVCYDKTDGKAIWGALDDVTGYATPLLVTLAGMTQIVVCAERRTVGLDPENGKVLWEYPWRVLNHQLPIAQPLVLSSNRFFLSASYFTGCAAVEVAHEGAVWSAKTIWQNKNLKNKFSSSVLFEGNIYGLDEDMLACLDAATGERRWKDGRYGYGELLLAGSHLVILSGEGELALVKASPDAHHELARFQAITGKTWNYPAIAGGRLIVRNAAEMACFDVSIH
jgi:outer membrane protein assembly factor BamB